MLIKIMMMTTIRISKYIYAIIYSQDEMKIF